MNHRCSNPGCRATTSGPQCHSEASLNIGVAAHITGASVGGPRFNAALRTEERTSAQNGIWLCQNCAKLVDNDEMRFPEDLLRGWKRLAEAEALDQIGKTPITPTAATDRHPMFTELRWESNPRFFWLYCFDRGAPAARSSPSRPRGPHPAKQAGALSAGPPVDGGRAIHVLCRMTSLWPAAHFTIETK